MPESNDKYQDRDRLNNAIRARITTLKIAFEAAEKLYECRYLLDMEDVLDSIQHDIGHMRGDVRRLSDTYQDQE